MPWRFKAVYTNKDNKLTIKKWNSGQGFRATVVLDHHSSKQTPSLFFNLTEKLPSDFQILPSDFRSWEFSNVSLNSDGEIRNSDGNSSARLKTGRCLTSSKIFTLSYSMSYLQHNTPSVYANNRLQAGGGIDLDPPPTPTPKWSRGGGATLKFS